MSDKYYCGRCGSAAVAPGAGGRIGNRARLVAQGHSFHLEEITMPEIIEKKLEAALAHRIFILWISSCVDKRPPQTSVRRWSSCWLARFRPPCPSHLPQGVNVSVVQSFRPRCSQMATGRTGDTSVRRQRSW